MKHCHEFYKIYSKVAKTILSECLKGLKKIIKTKKKKKPKIICRVHYIYKHLAHTLSEPY